MASIDLEKGETNNVVVDGDVKITKRKLGSCPIPFPFPLGLPCLLPFLVTGIMIIVGIVYLIYRYVFQNNNWNLNLNSFTLDTHIFRMVTKEAKKLIPNNKLGDKLALH